MKNNDTIGKKIEQTGVNGTNLSNQDESRRTGHDRRQIKGQSATERRQLIDRRELLINNENIITRYQKIPLFENFTKEQLLKIMRICAKKKIPPSHTICRPGQESINMYILLKGTVKIVMNNGAIWSRIQPQGVVGEIGLFSGTQFPGDIITESECFMLKITKLELMRIFEEDKDLYSKMLLNIVKNLSEKLISGHDEIVKLHYRLQALDQI